MGGGVQELQDGHLKGHLGQQITHSLSATPAEVSVIVPPLLKCLCLESYYCQGT